MLIKILKLRIESHKNGFTFIKIDLIISTDYYTLTIFTD